MKSRDTCFAEKHESRRHTQVVYPLVGLCNLYRDPDPTLALHRDPDPTLALHRDLDPHQVGGLNSGKVLFFDTERYSGLI